MSDAPTSGNVPPGGTAPGEPAVLAPATDLAPGEASPPAPASFGGDLPLPPGVVESDQLFLEESPEAPAIDANPGATAAQLETHMVGMAGVDPVLARFYTGRLQQALSQPAPTREQLDTGYQEAETAMREQYGEHAEKVAQAARREMREMARGFPQLPELLERTGLGNDLGVIRAFAGRAYDKWLAASGLPPRQ